MSYNDNHIQNHPVAHQEISKCSAYVLEIWNILFICPFYQKQTILFIMHFSPFFSSIFFPFSTFWGNLFLPHEVVCSTCFATTAPVLINYVP